MCGLTGFWDLGRTHSRDRLEHTVAEMCKTLAHRGPDDCRLWVDEMEGIALGFRRLAVIDLSTAGRQPMMSANGRFVMLFNGLIHNFRELRKQLENSGVRFAGKSDTEVIVEGFSAWGINNTVERLVGMFAIAVWDRQMKALHLIRDRIGIKPLYWAKIGGTVLFGSELKALVAYPKWEGRIDRGATMAYLRHGYVPSPHTIYEKVQKLAPGHILSIGEVGQPKLEQYWSLSAVARAGQLKAGAISASEATSHLDAILSRSISQCAISDVPIGVFLSGGTDSSMVAALMRAHSARDIHTFTATFADSAYDEAEFARTIATYLGTRHTELQIEPSDLMSVVVQLADHYDEPLADSSQIPTCLISKFARKLATVVLSGDGGDELFGGYQRYGWGSTFSGILDATPATLRNVIGKGLGLISSKALENLLSIVPKKASANFDDADFRTVTAVIESGNFEQLYPLLMAIWNNPGQLVQYEAGEVIPPLDSNLRLVAPDAFNLMRLSDSLGYLPDDILTKVDRASMAAGLEVRVPLLDHRICEFVWSLPCELLRRRGASKFLLRELLCRYIPRKLVERPKMGFNAPIDSWLKGPLRDWAEDLLDEARLREGGMLNATYIRKCWAQHLSGHRAMGRKLWSVLMLESWRRRWTPAV
jgi:asparagine synthase (glutamine-hydrolysing)